jgi:hypothetical protein
MRRAMLILSVLVCAGNAVAAEPAPKFEPNPRLAGIPEKTAVVVNEGYKGDRGVLAYSGMVYDHHRHKILTFGGGHATSFPTSVHEFDFQSLQWEQITEDIPRSEFTRENAVFDKDGKGLAGIKYKGKIWAASRHTYDGLAIAPDQCLMLCVQGVTSAGLGYGMDAKAFVECYTGMGLWIFDPVKRQWSVSKTNGLAVAYAGSAVWPKEPDWVYFYSMAGKFGAVNWRTEEVRDLGRIPAGFSYVGLEYWPDEEALVAFPKGPRDAGDPDRFGTRAKNRVMYRYGLAARKWTTVEVQGDAPATYDSNVVYDTRNRVFVCCSITDGFFHYYSPRENRWYKTDVKANANIRHHLVYDPVDNVHIVTASRWKTVAFKLSDEPGRLPGTRPAN